MDDNITVTFTDESDSECIRVTFNDELAVRLHTRSAVDLHYKLGLALCDWIGANGTKLVELLERNRNNGNI